MKSYSRFALFFSLIAIFSAFGLAQESGTTPNSRSKFHKKVFIAVERRDTDSFAVTFDFRGDGTIPSLGATEISVQMIAVKRTAAGKVDDITNLGSSAKLQLPSIQLVKEGEEQVARPSVTLRALPGVDAISVSIRDIGNGATKQFYLRVPTGGTTTGEIRF